MKLIETVKGEQYILVMTGAEMSKYKTFFDDFLNQFENPTGLKD